MVEKRGLSKIAVILIVIFSIVLIVGATVVAMMYINKANKPVEEVKLYDDYVEGVGFKEEEEETLEPLASGLVEYRNDELGVRFGYLNGMEFPKDETLNDGSYQSVILNKNKSTIIEMRVGKIDVSQEDIDHVQKQVETLRQELFKAETKIIEVEEKGKMVEQIIVPDNVSDIAVSYTIFAKQLSVKFTYTENDLKAIKVLTIKDGTVYSVTYKAAEEDYSAEEADKVAKSFSFIQKYSEIEKTDFNTVMINGETYNLPIKVASISGLSIDPKYSVQNISPNYFTVVTLYESQLPKYNAYVYNAKASVNEIGKGYITAISTDKNRGGDITIYKGITIGTTYERVKELLGAPAQQYHSDDKLTLTNIYVIEGVTIQLKFRNEDFTSINDSSPVVAILLKVKK